MLLAKGRANASPESQFRDLCCMQSWSTYIKANLQIPILPVQNDETAVEGAIILELPVNRRTC